MAEVYATPDHISPEPQEVSVDTLAQEELAGMQSRLSALADAGTVPDQVAASFVAALPGVPQDEDALKCSVASLGAIAMALVGPSNCGAKITELGRLRQFQDIAISYGRVTVQPSSLDR